jgi:hypothetical protein
MVVHQIKKIVCKDLLERKKNRIIYEIFLVNYVPLTSIFSTRVITGAKSTPDLNKLLERKQAGRMYNLSCVK